MTSTNTKTAAIVSAVTVAGIAWYALVEGIYFYLHGPRLSATFARANAVAGDGSRGGRGAAFPRMPWLGAVVYVVLVLAHALLSVWPALQSSCSSSSGATRTTTTSSSTAYVACLWRAVLLSAAVYVTYDLVTYITVLPFGAGTMMWDIFYGVVVVPCAVVAPVAASVAACLREKI